MNHKELIAAISAKAGMTKTQVEELLNATVKVCSDEMIEGKTIGFQSFGNFEVRKKEERLSVHPATQVRTLVPPKLVINFKQSNILKEKLNENLRHE
jgi:DNA-binding protein HU-beta